METKKLVVFTFSTRYEYDDHDRFSCACTAVCSTTPLRCRIGDVDFHDSNSHCARRLIEEAVQTNQLHRYLLACLLVCPSFSVLLVPIHNLHKYLCSLISLLCCLHRSQFCAIFPFFVEHTALKYSNLAVVTSSSAEAPPPAAALPPPAPAAAPEADLSEDGELLSYTDLRVTRDITIEHYSMEKSETTSTSVETSGENAATPSAASGKIRLGSFAEHLTFSHFTFHQSQPPPPPPQQRQQQRHQQQKEQPQTPSYRPRTPVRRPSTWATTRWRSSRAYCTCTRRTS